MMLVSMAAALLFVAQPALASTDMEAELAEMRDLVNGLQQKVDAQEEQLGHQGEMLEDAQQVVRQTQQDQASQSGLAKFLESVEVDGNVAGSYFWNFNKPSMAFGGNPGNGVNVTSGIGGNQGASFSGNFYRFHPDHNSFQLDQFWLGLGKPATEEARGGFRVDMVYGQTASAMNNFGTINELLGSIGYVVPGGQIPAALNGMNRTLQSDSASDFYLHQAYAEYLAPLGDGVGFKFGKFAALTGNESLDGTQNFHVTHSVLYNTFQPVDHLGFLISGMAGPVELVFGMANSGGQNISSPDWNSEKTYILSAAFSQDNMSVRGTINYGAEKFSDATDLFLNGETFGANNGSKSGLMNFVATYDPADNLSLWMNINYAWLQGAAAAGHGFGFGGRMAMSEKLGLATRFEYAADQDGFFGLGDMNNFLCAVPTPNTCNDIPTDVTTPPPGGNRPNSFPNGVNSEIASLVGTLDYALVENLVVRGEFRYDRVRSRGTNQFYKGMGSRDVRSQIVMGAQVYYKF